MKILYCTFPDQKEAEILARQAVQSGLAACANIIPGGLSIYQWNGEIQSDAECYLLLKTSDNKSEELAQFVKERHSYDCPCLWTCTPSYIDSDYNHWLLSQFR